MEDLEKLLRVVRNSSLKNIVIGNTLSVPGAYANNGIIIQDAGSTSNILVANAIDGSYGGSTISDSGTSTTVANNV